ncbi:MAG: cupin domain-containing protein [Steroidobacteraceae bacterium]
MYDLTLRHQARVDSTHALFLAISLIVLGGSGLLGGAVATAQDPVKVDAKHYKVEFENDKVRVLRINYGPHEKSVMHHHPASIAVFLTDGQARFTTPDGKTQDIPVKAGSAQWAESGKHLPENVGDKPFELILIELKTKAAPAK